MTCLFNQVKCRLLRNGQVVVQKKVGQKGDAVKTCSLAAALKVDTSSEIGQIAVLICHNLLILIVSKSTVIVLCLCFQSKCCLWRNRQVLGLMRAGQEGGCCTDDGFSGYVQQNWTNCCVWGFIIKVSSFIQICNHTHDMSS